MSLPQNSVYFYISASFFLHTSVPHPDPVDPLTIQIRVSLWEDPAYSPSFFTLLWEHSQNIPV